MSLLDKNSMNTSLIKQASSSDFNNLMPDTADWASRGIFVGILEDFFYFWNRFFIELLLCI